MCGNLHSSHKNVLLVLNFLSSQAIILMVHHPDKTTIPFTGSGQNTHEQVGHKRHSTKLLTW